MIFGIGTDIVEYARIEAMWQRHGIRLAQRLLSVAELPEYHLHAQPARFLAKRFAAKEAFAKAAGSGLRHPVSLSRISVAHDGLGKPVLQFDATLRNYLAQLGVSAHHLSISDERNMIVAFVVLETL
ncbi:MAG: holo-ACP synthase [Gallionella sp.]|nr:holo-ACP synthase [Gallionella sp.]MDP1939567.1 holo-ACP synthase [Gallionella sp.]